MLDHNILFIVPAGGVLDNISLDRLLGDGPGRQHWLKPIGPPKDHPDWDAPEHRTWTETEIEIHFHKSPAKIAVGAVIIAYRVRIHKLIYVAERLPLAEWSQEGIRSEYSRRRWPFYIKARNLTHEYGRVWNQYSLQPFSLAKEYNELHPDGTARLGSILRGNDKAAIPREFAQVLIRRIREMAQALRDGERDPGGMRAE
jgi:hypothetical protein